AALALERLDDPDRPLERVFQVGARVRRGREAGVLAGGEELLQVPDDGRSEPVLPEAIAHRVGRHGTRRKIELGGEVVADGACQRVVEGGGGAGTELLAGAGDRGSRRAPGAREARVAQVARQAAPATINGYGREPRHQRQELEAPEEEAPVATGAEGHQPAGGVLDEHEV